MNKITRIAISLALLVFGSQVSAYETTTHEILTQMAVARSVLMVPDNSLLAGLGFGSWDAFNYTSTDPKDPQFKTAMAIIDKGAVWEDNNYGWRSFNHFFDPQYNNFQGRGLTAGIALGNPSPDWTLEDFGDKTDFFDGTCPGRTALQGCPQEFSFKKGQQQLFAALTGIDPESRRIAASRTLQILGHVTHHLQDMAQPQHTRDDQHIHPLPIIKLVVDVNPPWSFYELYTEHHNDDITAMLKTNIYPVPESFSTARQFWNTPGAVTPQFGGMAEFTAQNFTSYGTQYLGRAGDANFIGAAPGFPLPNGMNQDGSNKTIVSIGVPKATSTEGVTIPAGMSDFIIGQVYDGFAPDKSTTDTKLAATSLLNEYETTSPRVFVENSIIYDERQKILLPRAVAFSAGLINHFFRGRIDLSMGATPTQWIIRNTGSQDMDGIFYIYSEDANGIRSQLPDARYVMSLSSQSSVEKTLSSPPPSGTQKLVAVFQGQIGAEGEATLSTGFYATAGKVIGYVPPAPKITTLSRTPSPMTAGVNFIVSWTTTNADSIEYICTSTSSGLAGGGKLSSVNGSFTGVANVDWVGHPSTCTYTARGAGGTATFVENNVTTVAPIEPEIVIVGTSYLIGNPYSKQAFRWSSRAGLRPLGVGYGAVYSEAWGVSANGKSVVGSTTGIVNTTGIFLAYPWQNDPTVGVTIPSNTSLSTVPMSWSGNNSGVYLNGNSILYGEAWKASDNGRLAFGIGKYMTNYGIQNPTDMSWGVGYETGALNIGTTRVNTKNELTSADGSITLTTVGTKAAYVKKGVTTIIPLPPGYNASEAHHVVIIN